jgi:hypothetical protein
MRYPVSVDGPIRDRPDSREVLTIQARKMIEATARTINVIPDATPGHKTCTLACYSEGGPAGVNWMSDLRRSLDWPLVPSFPGGGLAGLSTGETAF